MTEFDQGLERAFAHVEKRLDSSPALATYLPEYVAEANNLSIPWEGFTEPEMYAIAKFFEDFFLYVDNR